VNQIYGPTNDKGEFVFDIHTLSVHRNIRKKVNK